MIIHAYKLSNYCKTSCSSKKNNVTNNNNIYEKNKVKNIRILIKFFRINNYCKIKLRNYIYNNKANFSINLKHFNLN